VPKLGIKVAIHEAYTQCSKAFIRSNLWDPERHLSASDFASGGEIRQAIRPDPNFDAVTFDAERADRYARREGFY
jgi:uncharacterized protein